MGPRPMLLTRRGPSPPPDLVNVFESFLPQLLLYPNPSDPLNGEAAALLMRDPRAYEAKVRDWVARYATQQAPPASAAVAAAASRAAAAAAAEDGGGGEGEEGSDAYVSSSDEEEDRLGGMEA